MSTKRTFLVNVGRLVKIDDAVKASLCTFTAALTLGWVNNYYAILAFIDSIVFTGLFAGRRFALLTQKRRFLHFYAGTCTVFIGEYFYPELISSTM
jgi:hypothetical protein